VAPWAGNDPSSYIAEYQALTTRITYWINLQYTVALSAATLLVLLAATSSQLPREVLLWGAAGIVDAFLAGYYYTIFEMMNNAQYIECVLAPEIRKMLPRVVFWQYERYRTCNKFYSPTGLFIPMLGSIAAPAVVIALRWRPSSLADLIGGVVTISLVCWSYALARTGGRAQLSLWKCATEEAGRTEHGERNPNTETT